ncbi:MAG TPA: PLP-dependent aminotransferase family protein, partial [Candidatus Binatia bacterium]|nr:PLP-dependent aminotransferase family protein [Candidatus Binatia bacterium]
MFGTLALDRGAADTLHHQLYASLREAILAGRLVPGVRLPSTRTLAADLVVARNTVVTAFEQLIAEGYLTSRVGDGTRVAAVLPEALLEARRVQLVGAVGPVPQLSERGRLLAGSRRPGPYTDGQAFVPGMPALDMFPRELWARLVARRARRPPPTSQGYAHSAGLPLLRQAVATYLGAARGVRCDPDQVIVVAGAQAGLDLAARLLLDAGDPAWIEEPGYLGARGALISAGARLVPVPVDAEGIDVEAGARAEPAARLVYVTPSHHFPLGGTMTLQRRLALLDWAARSGAWVLEDDYDSEYRYGGRPFPAMQGLDAAGRVVYVGTFSKTMFPALRAGWLVVPPALVDPFRAAVRNTGHTVPGVIQAALADFMNDGHFGAHVRRMRTLYAARQERLVTAAHRRLDGLLDVRPADAGMQLAAALPPGTDDRAVAQAAYDAGVIAPALSSYYLGSQSSPGLFLGYAGVKERDIGRG